MELKYIDIDDVFSTSDSSNRTFMELKFLKSIGDNVPRQQVLIVPLWN